jgi:hypothetical protein
MVVENYLLFGFLPSTREVLVLPYLLQRAELTETPRRDVARFSAPFADIVCLLGYDVE